MLKKILSLLLLSWIVSSCATLYQSNDPHNVASIYNPSSTPLHPQYNVFHVSDSVSVLTLRVFTQELLFNAANPQNQMQAHLKIRYRLYQSYDDQSLADSGTVEYTIREEDGARYFAKDIRLKAKRLRKYSLHLVATDMLRKKSTQHFLLLDKTTYNTEQDFLLKKPENGLPFFREYIRAGEQVNIEYRSAPKKTLFVQYFSKDFPLPAPPFAKADVEMPQIKPDSLWQYDFNGNFLFELPYKGTYRFSVDEEEHAGITTFNFENQQFPRVQTSKQMLRPLKYLTSSQEFEKMKNAPNHKLEVDNFWLAATGNTDRARELIRIFYNRVQLANFYFTSYTEGWRTDRGMIYLIFGPPAVVHKSDRTERWEYSGKSSDKVVFYFEHQPHNFADNYYQLRRDNVYSSRWREAVEAWRNGRAYSTE